MLKKDFENKIKEIVKEAKLKEATSTNIIKSNNIYIKPHKIYYISRCNNG